MSTPFNPGQVAYPWNSFDSGVGRMPPLNRSIPGQRPRPRQMCTVGAWLKTSTNRKVPWSKGSANIVHTIQFLPNVRGADEFSGY
jgi:hypothetical protein